MLEIILHFKYPLIFLLSFVEGPIIALICGFLLKSAYLSFIPTYTALIIGDLVGDIAWYCVGFFFGHTFVRRFGKYFSVNEEGIATITRIFHRHKTWILFISKITMGFGFALVTLITAGLVKIPFRYYLALNALGQLLWTGTLLILGYSLGHAYTSVNNTLTKISIIALFVMVIVALIGFGKYMRQRTINKSL